MSESSIITGQFVHINQTTASIGDRLVARLIDLIIIIFYVVAVTYAIFKLELSWTRTQVFFTIVAYLPVMLYSLLFEVLNNGQSIGKRLMRIRVVNKDGTTPTLGSFIMRWMIWPVDMTGIGLLVALLSKDSQRIGDLAAGTIVIKLNNYRNIHISLDEFSHLSSDYQPVFSQAEELSLKQVELIQKTLALPYGEERDRRIQILNEKVRKTLNITSTKMPAERFLSIIIRDYQHFAFSIY